MQLQIDEEKKEIKAHGSYGFPLLVSYERLSYFETGSFLWHWHPEIELTLIQEGEIAYQVNDSLYCLREGEGLFCNSNMLHTGHREGTEDCHYLSVTFHPRLLYGYSSSLMMSKYMENILKNPALASIHLKPEADWQGRILKYIREIMILHETRPSSMELQMQILLLEIWREIYENVDSEELTYPENDRDMERIRKLIGYMQSHYSENITLETLAEQIHLCKSESCRLFKHYMNETMFDYLLNFRVEKSLELLRSTSLDITQIAGMVGFVTPGYYSRIFKRKMGCTPGEYRRSRRK